MYLSVQSVGLRDSNQYPTDLRVSSLYSIMPFCYLSPIVRLSLLLLAQPVEHLPMLYLTDVWYPIGFLYKKLPLANPQCLWLIAFCFRGIERDHRLILCQWARLTLEEWKFVSLVLVSLLVCIFICSLSLDGILLPWAKGAGRLQL